MSSLPHLSGDVFTELAHVLLGNDLQRLLMCGSRALSAKLYHAIDTFVVETTRFRPFPFSALKLPKLRSLEVSLIKPYEFYPIRLDGRSMLPSQPLQTLLELKLSCAQSFSVCGDGIHQPPLKELLPQLKTLHLSGTHEMIEGNSPTVSVLSYLSLLPLPRDLESLELPSNVTIVESYNKDAYSSMIWPVGMKRLTVSCFAHGSILYQLPSRLEYLNLEWKSVNPHRVPLSKLPRNLNELTLVSSYSYTVVVDVPLPPNLKVLNVHELGYPTEHEQYEACADPPKLPFPSLDLLPASLTSLRPLHTFVQSAGSQPLLPSKLRSIALSMATMWMIPLLPSRLVSLSLPTAGIGHIELASLPQTLELLSIGLTSGESFAHLPKSLKSLHASFLSAVRVTHADFLRLPSSIQELSFSVDTLEDDTVFSALPKSIKTLRATATKESRLFKDFGMYVPSSITDLRLSLSDLNSIWPGWILQIRERNIPLINLDIFPSSSDRSVPAFDHSFLENLPPSLLSLRVSAPSNWIQAQNCLHKLPNLHTLYVMPVSTSSPVTLTDTHFAKLPSSLTYLRVPTFKSLTPRFWKLLPPGIRFVSCGHGVPPPDFEAAKSSYYEQPSWQKIFKPIPVIEAHEEDDGPM